MTPTETRTRLLDAAERHFSERGFAGTSLREITADAKANLAAVSYHFGSKEDLFVAVVARRMEPLNLERQRLLDEAEARAAGRALTVEEILEAIVAPMLRAGGEGPCVLRMIGRASGDSSAPLRRVVDGPLREIRARVHKSLSRALPHLSDRELSYRMHFTMSVVKSIASDHHLISALSEGRCDATDLDATLRELIPFLSAGLRAPSVARKVARGGRKAHA